MKELIMKTASQLSALLKSREISAVELLHSYNERIDAVDSKTNVYLTRVDTIEKAKQIDRRRMAGEELPALAGIPFALKDNICTKGIKTTCASKMLESFIPPYDATIWEKLQKNETVLLGKTNMDEFAMGSSTENSAFMNTKNPRDISRIPGGSSGGSAAAVAAGEAVFAIGTDTGGSIRQPASMCGVVGLKPTYGRVSRYGIVAFASSLDQAGPLTKDVTDAAMVLSAMSGLDTHDASSVNIAVPDYTQCLKQGVKGLKVGLPKEYFDEGIHPQIRQSVYRAAKALEEQGAIIGECSLPRMPYALAAYYIISSAEACSNLGRFDGIKYGYRAKNYSDIYDMIRQSRSEGFGDEVKVRIMLGTYALSAGYYDAYYKRAQQVRSLIIEDYKKAFTQYDVLLTPTSPVTAWELGGKSESLGMYMADVCTVSVNVAGLPAISLPYGVDENNLPIGAQLMGQAFGEKQILRAAYALEQSIGTLGVANL